MSADRRADHFWRCEDGASASFDSTASVCFRLSTALASVARYACNITRRGCQTASCSAAMLGEGMQKSAECTAEKTWALDCPGYACPPLLTLAMDAQHFRLEAFEVLGASVQTNQD
jgi:hypothetical protein